MKREDIIKMMGRLQEGIKNPARFAQVAPGHFMKWANKVELQKVLDGYSQLVKEQQAEIEELKNSKETTNAGTQPA